MSSQNKKLKSFERLARKKEFERVYAGGKRVSARWFICYVLFKKEGTLRLGVVSSKRVGGAVVRNRAKRVLREIFRKNRPRIDVAADVVIIARAAIKSVRSSDVEKAYVSTVGGMLDANCTRNG